MPKEDIGILLTGAGVIVCLALWLIDKAGKNTMAITIIALILIAGLSLWGILLFPWIGKPQDMALRVWRIALVGAVVLLAVARFGIWVWPEEKPSLSGQSQSASLPSAPAPVVSSPAKELTSTPTPAKHVAQEASLPAHQPPSKPTPTLVSAAQPVATPAATPAIVVNAPGGIPILGGNVNNPTVINNSPPPPVFSFTEEVVTPISENGEKVMKVHIRTNRSVPGAIVGILFSGPVQMGSGNGSPDDPTLTGSGAVQMNWGGPLESNKVPIPNSVAISINIPAAFSPGQELIVPIRSKVDVHVVQVLHVGG